MSLQDLHGLMAEHVGHQKGVPGGIFSTVRLIFCTRKGWKIFHPARRLYDVRRNQ
ncbi:hypothetical protein [Anaerovibrio slackiae]|uniref:hypothetical protein n=1 Tax=Anaerovibrio slackiae TaxID=2652309 RepID=UPI003870E6BD